MKSCQRSWASNKHFKEHDMLLSSSSDWAISLFPLIRLCLGLFLSFSPSSSLPSFFCVCFFPLWHPGTWTNLTEIRLAAAAMPTEKGMSAGAGGGSAERLPWLLKITRRSSALLRQRESQFCCSFWQLNCSASSVAVNFALCSQKAVLPRTTSTTSTPSSPSSSSPVNVCLVSACTRWWTRVGPVHRGREWRSGGGWSEDRVTQRKESTNPVHLWGWTQAMWFFELLFVTQHPILPPSPPPPPPPHLLLWMLWELRGGNDQIFCTRETAKYSVCLDLIVN